MSEVSVLIPSYNHAQFVERTLRSIFEQSLKPIKLLVIDDGSRDDSPAIIERVLRDCPFDNELIVRENRGLCKTLNEGYAACKGEYFAYLGSDDIWLPDFLKKSTGVLKGREKACLSFGDAYLIDENDFIIDDTGNWFDFGDGDLLPSLLEGKIFPSPSVMYRRSLLPVKPWNERSRLEDYDLYLRLAPEHDFANNGKHLCGWRQHGSNTSGELPEMFPEFMKAHGEALERLDMDREDRKKLTMQLMFEAAINYGRHGYKKEAFRAMIANTGGAESPVQILQLLFRLLIPRFLFQWNRRRKYEKARKLHGKLDLSGRSGES